MGSFNDTTRSKVAFKKRAHRPWQPTLLEGMGEDSQNVFDAAPKLQDKQFEFMQKQLETTLDIKSQEHAHLSQTLNALDDHRITLGGFLRPKDIFLVTEQASLQKTASLMHELKEKEQEIIAITQHLKITQAEELAKQADINRTNEVKARQAAEEKAIFALRQAHQAAEHIQHLEERTRQLEQIKSSLEYNVVELEDKLNLATHELEVLGQKTSLEGDERQKLEYEIRCLTSKLKEIQQINHALNDHLAILTENLEDASLTKMDHQEEALKAFAKVNELETLLAQETARFEQRLVLEKETQVLIQQRYQVLEEKMASESAQTENLIRSHKKTEEQLSLITQQFANITTVITAERNLRLLYEEKMNQALLQIEKSEMMRRAETQARKLAEEKLRNTVDQADKAMLHLLNTRA